LVLLVWVSPQLSLFLLSPVLSLADATALASERGPCRRSCRLYLSSASSAVMYSNGVRCRWAVPSRRAGGVCQRSTGTAQHTPVSAVRAQSGRRRPLDSTAATAVADSAASPRHVVTAARFRAIRAKREARESDWQAGGCRSRQESSDSAAYCSIW
jgi:hypothetical protein